MSHPGSDSPSGGALHHWLRQLSQARFSQLLAALSLLLITAPVASAVKGAFSRVLATWLIVVVLSLVLIAAAAAVSSTSRQARTALMLAGMCLITMLARPVLQTLSDSVTDYVWVEITEGVLTTLFLSYVVYLIIGSLFFMVSEGREYSRLRSEMARVEKNHTEIMTMLTEVSSARTNFENRKTELEMFKRYRTNSLLLKLMFQISQDFPVAIS